MILFLSWILINKHSKDDKILIEKPISFLLFSFWDFLNCCTVLLWLELGWIVLSKEDFKGEQTFDFEFGVPGVAVPPGIFDDSLIPPWLLLPFVMGVLKVVTDDCINGQTMHSKQENVCVYVWVCTSMNDHGVAWTKIQEKKHTKQKKTY